MGSDVPHAVPIVTAHNNMDVHHVCLGIRMIPSIRTVSHVHQLPVQSMWDVASVVIKLYKRLSCARSAQHSPARTCWVANASVFKGARV